jgi:preprotein translocase subunit SecA
MPERERLIRLMTIDDLWSEYLAEIADYRSGIQWVSWSGRDPLHEYLINVDRMFHDLEIRVEDESMKRVAEAELTGIMPKQRGATWTYLTTDQPFGTVGERLIRGIAKKVKGIAGR